MTARESIAAFGCEVGAEAGRGAAGADPDEQALPGCAHVGEDEAVDVELGHELVGVEGFGGPEAHVAGVVGEDVDGGMLRLCFCGCQLRGILGW